MTSPRLMKLFAFAALVAAGSAIYIWWQNGEPPPQWLRQAAIVLAIATVLTALVGKETRPRLVLRFLAALLALISVIAFAADWSAPAIDGVAPVAKSLLDHLSAFTPRLVAALKAAITGALGATAWDPVATSVLKLPASLLFAVLAVVAGYAGRPRRQVQIFAN